MAKTFGIGDRVYAGDWCYGIITDIDYDAKEALVEFETERGGGSLWWPFNELIHTHE